MLLARKGGASVQVLFKRAQLVDLAGLERHPPSVIQRIFRLVSFETVGFVGVFSVEVTNISGLGAKQLDIGFDPLQGVGANGSQAQESPAASRSSCVPTRVPGSATPVTRLAMLTGRPYQSPLRLSAGP